MLLAGTDGAFTQPHALASAPGRRLERCSDLRPSTTRVRRGLCDNPPGDFGHTLLRRGLVVFYIPPDRRSPKADVRRTGCNPIN